MGRPFSVCRLVLLLLATLLPGPIAAGWAGETAEEAAFLEVWRPIEKQARDLLSTLSPESPDPRAGRQLASQAADLASRGQWWDAQNIQQSAIRRGLEDPDKLLTLANYQSGMGRPDMARVAIAAHVLGQTDTRGQADGVARIGDLFLNENQPEQARLMYQAADTAAPGLARAEDGLKALTGEKARVRQMRPDAERAVPRMCLDLTAAPLKDSDTPLDPYVTVTPAADVAVAVIDRALCIDGMKHGTTYDVVLKEGLPFEGGGRLAEPLSTSVAVPDRKPRVAFAGDAFILPAQGERQVTVRTVNLDALKLELMRIDDRALADHLRDMVLDATADRSELNSLREESGELVWEGTLDIDATPNQEVATAVPLGRILADPQPGLYVLAAADPREDAVRYWSWPVQWLLITDIGLQTAQGADGLSVFARSLATGRPMSGLTLALVARNNDELGAAVTDRNGMARFQSGLLAGEHGNTPAFVMAYAPGGTFSFLALDGPAFDLSDRGVGGRAAPGPLDAFLYTERGIYRPGESVHLVSLLRDAGARALGGLPLTLKVLRPDGVQVSSQVLTGQGTGAYDTTVKLLADSRTGRWTVTAHVDPNADPIGSVSFLVEDFVPLRTEVRLSAGADRLDLTAGEDGPAAATEVSVQADFLYGAPATDQVVQGDLVLSTDPEPFAAFADFSFGLTQEPFDSQRQSLPETRTDATGAATVPVALDSLPDTTQPLRAMVRVDVLDAGGRGSGRTMVLPVRHQAVAVGVRAPFKGEAVEADSAVSFDLAAVGPDGAGLPGQSLDWVLYREESNYTWYESGGSWNYHRTVTDVPVSSGRVETGADGLVSVTADVTWGNYRIEASAATGLSAASVRFDAGWWTRSLAAADSPDTLEVTTEAESVRPGGRARLHLKAPFAGEALVSVVNDRVLDVLNVPLPEEGLTVELPVTEAWGTGAYVVATAFRPGQGPGASGAGGGGAANAKGPGRAIGVQWLPVAMEDRTLAVSIDVPDTIRPRGTLEVPVSVTGGQGPVYLTLAAVDEGILGLTGFESPDPTGYFYGKRDLAMDWRDAYGRLLTPSDARPGRLREGGDAAGRHLPGLPDSSIETVALFSGIVAVDSDGRATIPLRIPDFNGRLRLMVVAFSASAVGSADASVTVRDRMVAQATLPRFLAPGDRGTMTLTMDNVEGPAGTWQLTVSGSGAVSVEDGVQALALDQAGKQVVRLPVTGRTLGSGAVHMTLKAPDGKTRDRSWSITVRPPGPRQMVAHRLNLEPGGEAQLDAGLMAGLVPGSVSAALTLSTVPNLDPLGTARALRFYPYGCLEQTVSRSFVALYGADLDLASAWPSWSGRDVLAQDVQRVVAMQRGDGGFALWDSQGALEPWLTNYTMDFLLRAKEQDVPVPDFALERGLAWLASTIRDGDFSDSELPTAAYAHYVLARAGAIGLGPVRYFHDTYLSRMTSPLARVQTAAALAILGDKERAVSALHEALSPSVQRVSTGSDYGSTLRDTAATLALGLETGLLGQDGLAVADKLAGMMAESKHLSTQERGWLLLAARALMRAQGTVEALVGGQTVEAAKTTVSTGLSRASLDAGVPVTNLGARSLRVVATVDGLPGEPLPRSADGISVERSWYHLDGSAADPATVTQNDLLVAVVTGEVTDPMVLDGGDGDSLLVVDLLPAGVEIDLVDAGSSRSLEGVDWLPELSWVDHSEARDDRYVAAVTVHRDEPTFALAYLVRAVSPGDFVAPGVMAESMYRPALNGTGRPGRMTVAPR